ncbi:glycosyltransferase family 2 protein [Clostridium perfringens]|uniref:glycosyltransferase family 2 protein n=1 Tax=Clostridium perfringens TaxID=1502 RepID=UPI00214732ED|nr:glycosyltransferase family 2 protein [Clostridium perfringens]MDM0973045.1 glycosyltransferase family 2 protein [Clostridium perfringens]MDU3774053.1 glycosyltransferase family 2 protein [Clostridium perfringens]UUR84414.1 glycosyltransferase family 2 protein [Clostridium perfringens]
MNVKVILTCFNRREKTINCIESLVKGNPKIDFSFIVVDDNSSDGTIESINKLNYDIKLEIGDGNLYWSGGMYKGINAYFNEEQRSNYILLVNDDVKFFDNVIERLINLSIDNNDSVVVGATCDNSMEFTYGAMKLISNRKTDLYYHVKPNNKGIICDTFNANCVLIKDCILRDVGNFDKVYRHSLADLDYGFMIRRKGYNIISSDKFIGICNRNSIKGTWRDTSLTRLERIKRKESVKGSPIKEWFYFMKKNFGYIIAIRYSITPYLRILLNK